jgi:hypothetical protein
MIPCFHSVSRSETTLFLRQYSSVIVSLYALSIASLSLCRHRLVAVDDVFGSCALDCDALVQEEELAVSVGMAPSSKDLPVKSSTLGAMNCSQLAYCIVGVSPKFTAMGLMQLGGNLVTLAREEAAKPSAGRSKEVRKAVVERAEKVFRARLLQLCKIGQDPTLMTMYPYAVTFITRSRVDSRCVVFGFRSLLLSLSCLLRLVSRFSEFRVNR